MNISVYSVVREFEAALSEYTGAPYVVTTNSGTMALFLAFKIDQVSWVEIPKRTYCSVPMAAVLAGIAVSFSDINWHGAYRISPTGIWDSARRFTSGMYIPGQMMCVSFQTSKILGIEQGGAILLDDDGAAQWLRRARYDGREEGEKLPRQLGYHCYMNPSTAALGLSKLACLPRDNPDQCGSEAFEDLSRLSIW